MLEVKHILDQIENTSGRLDKENIIKRNEDNELFKEVLKFMYCDLIVTGISKKKLEKLVKPTSEFKPIGNLMEYLKENNTGSDKDIFLVQEFISRQPVEMQDFYRAMATKNMKLGFTKNTLNSIFGKGFIEDFKIMLADRFDKHSDKIKGEFLLTLKYDGIRNVLIKENGKVTMKTRQGKTVTGLIDIEKEAEGLPDNIVLDGELILRNNKGLNSADLFRETMKIVRKDGAKKDVELHVFDMLPVSEFKQGKSSLGAIDRKEKLKAVIDDLQPSWIKEVPILYKGNDKGVIPEILDKVEKEGFEGLMINTSKGLYTNKRSRELLKVKTFFTADVEIVGFEEGQNKYTSMLGKVNVLYKGFEVGIGSGFTDTERKEIWANRDDYLGRVCEISYFEESNNQKDDSISLRFGTWKGLREIGKEVSYN